MTSVLRSFFYLLLKFPLRLFLRSKIVLDAETAVETPTQPIFYIVSHQSASDLLALQKACKDQNLPDPLSKIKINNKLFERTICLAKPTSLFGFKRRKTQALQQGLAILNEHHIDKTLDGQLIPVNLIWGRIPTKEKNNANVSSLLAEQASPTWLRKFFIVLFLGRDNLIRFSEVLSLRNMSDNHGNDKDTAHKLLRVARFHFHRQNIAAKGPRLIHREQMFTALFANPSIKRIIKDEAKNKNISPEKVKKQALAMMEEIAGDYSVSLVRLGERILRWLWGRLYTDIKVNNSQVLRKLAQDGHEIIYVPCHRSHMDYLLLSYVIIQEGLVMPRIAAGINLNFWPAGAIFRKGGAFFIRRSFAGNRLYSTIFREYLGLLFERGYAVKYYTEGGRSRTGRLLPPKTGMLAMTIQSLLRGIDRPLTLVPVYLGYEHVMEVGTYHKELSGSEKKNESILGVLKAIKNLRNYGNGYVNFGEPININNYLTEQVPHWKDAIDPIDPQKPNWLTPTVNDISNQLMTNINQCAALNGVALVALILHASENKALAKHDLEKHLDFFLKIQREAPFSKELTIPEENGADLLAHVISLNKVTISEDSFGTIISLDSSASLEMRYYRNNILHTYALSSLICRLLTHNSRISNEQIVSQSINLLTTLKEDLFLWQTPEQITVQVKELLTTLESNGVIKHTESNFWALTEDTELLNQIHLMAECIDESIQRLAIITSLATRLAPLTRRELEEKVVAIAKRLAVLNNITAPEFIDKKSQSTLINTLREQGYLALNDDGLLVVCPNMTELKTSITNLVSIEVLQSIAR
ncbi:glycerol-3-phosphate 1-O-acyltransferase PlsB [Colwellia sp. 1_MG-2023]|uniref:glycerol-3-phosphate 1-O-acyltransferase PlsB n=1 Tax=unclassified Colwellia TaxID=196834 RepID=UPI001C08718A|nr:MULTISPECIES: glycerol-3-phosphate 1-O-acyltransferase PlsB [unclassified Colwellia]MBU2923724.1 glycerol-3-phosphate 1-O-acyltransferase PlsB [Colwellia sp. C2M11]MDO6652176.1 glycerol-3-phosphate 1-O-acyltransferase PlsB [Colwellia sp. 3_MG-2023]MDO6664655.1 glycerol-3-phosphate 1-O-acyltransferase PlsB [Colwellia sp. 2_MG-2023]MDO6689006.1 glycerol-3-phosphate 1-O-acyltransferase PlsB [Colwellia sp. 1_MG-2023]